MKTFVTCALLLWMGLADAQSIGLRLGHSIVPADHISVRYEHWTNGAINFSVAGFFETSKTQGLNYSCYGADLLGEYAGSRDQDPLPLFGWRVGMGLTWQIENEPWLYKNLNASARMNYGLVAEGSVVCNITEVFRLSLFGQQKYLLRSMLGSTKFCFGLGLNYTFPSL